MKRLFSTDTDDGTITVIDAEGSEFRQLAKIDVGNGPRGGVKFTKAGIGYVANHAGDTISEIDALKMTEVGRIKVGVAPIGVAIVPGDRFALVSIAGENAVAVVDLVRRRRVHAVSVGREPRHPAITPDGKTAFVPISGANYIAKLDISMLHGRISPMRMRASLMENVRIELGHGTAPYSFAISPDGRFGVSANNQAPFISIVDLSSGKVVHEVSVGTKGARGTTYSPDGNKAFVSIEDTSEIVALDLESGTIENRFKVGPGPRGLLFDANRGLIYASAFARTVIWPIAGAAPNTISVINIDPGRMDKLADMRPTLEEIKVGNGPCSVTMFAA